MERAIKGKAFRLTAVWIVVAVLGAVSVVLLSQRSDPASSEGPAWLEVDLLGHGPAVTFSAFTYDSGDGNFTGDINSTAPDCVASRTVNIYLFAAGSTAPEPVATATTDASGGFTSTSFPAVPGTTYRAVVSARGGSGQHCNAGTADHTVPL